MTALIYKDLIEAEFQQLISNESNAPWNSLYKAANYSFLSGGKRVRPLLTLTTAECLGGSVEKALIPALAIECIHTFSLIHDDLPAIDNDDMRRGNPSLHRAFPEGLAILTGDFLLSYSFELLAGCNSLDPQQRLDLIQVLCRDTGDKGMIGGQVLDIEGYKDSIELVHSMKTGALIAASVEFGAIIASHPERKKMRQFGEKIGLAFQIVDDILDAEENDSLSIVASIGIDKAKVRADTLFQEALSLLQDIPADMTPLSELAKMLVTRSS